MKNAEILLNIIQLAITASVPGIKKFVLLLLSYIMKGVEFTFEADVNSQVAVIFPEIILYKKVL